ncbi:hypothetical protein F5B22DRAFT_130335 [Xylaria bambusicola]|uniref:uncharacterized protein n=1 Tax=Xylaria bambusicola TaxID=326684 RepID=UPI002008C3B8|nr:uncharacterized protein F5B22DRAFT_130335 [Xylaria bambusicola]KAI0517147.1 hypothetical protein F5B22DRAFT_130335 [Xylaria bambusicola]
MPSASYFRFFDLPAELRTNILSYLLISRYGIVLYNCTLFGLTATDRVTFLYIFLVNVQMYQEASAIFYSRNRFILNGQSHRLPGHLTKAGGFLSPQGRDARRRVQTLSLYLTRVGGEFENVLAPAISDMILSGSLRSLKICLGPPSSQHARISGPNINIMTTVPFQALLDLLADPDLQHVELCVWKVHWSIFCRFHENLEASTKEKTSETVDDHGLATIRGHPDWIQLDWQAMIENFRAGERILKIKDVDS